MSESRKQFLLSGFSIAAFFSLYCFSLPKTASAYSPESPEVRAMVAKAIAYLESSEEERLGGKCLIALALYKNGAPKNHPLIVAATERCLEFCRGNLEKSKEYIYSIGLAIIYLCEMDALAYRPEIEKLLKLLEFRQKPHGGFGYQVLADDSPAQQGDTSMTQYAVLSFWTAKRHGIDVDRNLIVSTCNWLLRTQDPSGAWGYQGIDPGKGIYNRVPQKEMSLSLTTAGLGSVYISANLLGFSKLVEVKEVTGLPAALKLVKEKGKATEKKPSTNRVQGTLIRRAIMEGEHWFANNYVIYSEGYTKYAYYYLYSLERYMSFRELVTGRVMNDWYDEGVELMKQKQDVDGSWRGTSGRPVATAFATLFLLRSMKRSIEDAGGVFGDGRLTGGRGLPKNTANIKLKEGRVVGIPLNRKIDSMLEILEGRDQAALDSLVEDSQGRILKIGKEESLSVRDRLRKLAKDNSPQKRAISLKQLAKMRNFDDVPLLIEGLTDENLSVVNEARDGLRFISRKFDGFGLPKNSSKDQRRITAEKWRQWYLEIRPYGEILELE